MVVIIYNVNNGNKNYTDNDDIKYIWMNNKGNALQGPHDYRYAPCHTSNANIAYLIQISSLVHAFCSPLATPISS